MATGPEVWLLLLRHEMENMGTDSAGSSSTDLSDLLYADLVGPSATSSEEDLDILPSVELSVENVGPGLAAPSKAGPCGESGEELVLPSIPVPREGDSDGIIICRNGCGPDEENIDTVELGCQCRGNMSRVCMKCLLTWFGPRIMIENDMRCEVCQTPLNESVRGTVLSAWADHTGGRDILIEALGPPLVRAHTARRGGHAQHAQVQMLPLIDEEHDVNFDELLDAPQGAADAFRVPHAAPASLNTPAPASPAPSPPISAPNQQQHRRSFWTKIRRYTCFAAPPAPVL